MFEDNAGAEVGLFDVHAQPVEVIEIAKAGLGEKQMFSVTWRGRELLRSRDPEHDAARALLAKGITGTLRVRWRGAAHDASRVDIERAARRSVRETRGEGPKFAPWKVFDGFDADAS